jgi:hypothetical protein
MAKRRPVRRRFFFRRVREVARADRHSTYEWIAEGGASKGKAMRRADIVPKAKLGVEYFFGEAFFGAAFF